MLESITLNRETRCNKRQAAMCVVISVIKAVTFVTFCWKQIHWVGSFVFYFCKWMMCLNFLLLCSLLYLKKPQRPTNTPQAKKPNTAPLPVITVLKSMHRAVTEMWKSRVIPPHWIVKIRSVGPKLRTTFFGHTPFC